MKSPKDGNVRESISIMHRFHFTSALKRMAVTVKVRRLLHSQRSFRVMIRCLQRNHSQSNTRISEMLNSVR